ncbi:MAG TPA: class I lanthipeptide [Kofleriaceae bacterium]|nr:class I lanthipeptide [Kofleriaceae bacterium]
MSRRPGRKLSLKRETLRKLDAAELGQAAGGGRVNTAACAGGGGTTVSGGCATAGCASDGCLANTMYCVR